MIAQAYKEMLGAKSVIREISEWSTARGAEIGYDNVFHRPRNAARLHPHADAARGARRRGRKPEPPLWHGLHRRAYLYDVGRGGGAGSRAALRRRAGAERRGAAGALAHALRCVGVPGQNVVTFAPFFPEYKPYVEGAGLALRVAPPRTADFQPDLDALDALLDENTAAVLINSPNNPSGVAYSAETLARLAQKLTAASRAYGHHIFLISDEPYREIAFGGVAVPYPAKFYDDTLTCYSFSKSLSVPGERIGYLAANPRCEDADLIVPMCGQISRGTGHNCPSGLFQRAVARCIDDTSDLSVYETNMELIYAELKRLGFTVQKPDGTFYIFPKALEADANAFCRKAMAYDLALVPGDTFGCPGYFRMAYCIGTEKVRRSFAALERFVREEYGVQK